MKGEDNNIEKKVCNVKKPVPNAEDSHHPKKRNYTLPIKDKKSHPWNTPSEHIWCEIVHLHDIPMLTAPKADVMGSEWGRWCNFHMVKGHHTEDFYQLKKEIETLIHEGHLRKYVKGNSSHSSDKFNLRGWDDARIPRPNKAKKAP